MSNNPCRRRIFAPAATAILALLLAGARWLPRTHAAEPRAKKIVLLAGTVHQGPGGHPSGTHEYELTARLLKHALTRANLPVRAEVHFDGWPRDPATLDDADTIVVISDGADRNQQDHPLLVGDRLAFVKKQMDRGCGLVAIHWSVFVPNDRGGPEFLEWIGGYFDYQSGEGPRKWFSKIQTAATRPRPASPDHPITRGMKAFELRDEYYYNIRFRERDPRLVPILTTSLPGETGKQIVAWAIERSGGGRGFGFTGGHFFDNWGVEDFRRMVTNAILWTAHVEVPAGGVPATPALPAETSVTPADKPISAVIVTGHNHPAHAWRETTEALQEALALDRRMHTTVVTDPEFLATQNLFGHDVVVLNYCNWQRGGLSDAARTNFQKYLADGGGLAIIHFANGAFHASLPETPPSDWLEYRNICRRVWEHGPSGSSHDPYGRFKVHVVKDHPITAGMNSFETIDELYCNQQGELPIEVLATAHSTITGRDEPMAFVYEYGKGRVFQTVLGHAAESIRAPGAAALIRRGTVWAAGHPQRAVDRAPLDNHSKRRASAPPPLLTRRVVDPELELVPIDYSPDESLLSVKCDTMGRLFVGGREALFVYEPDAFGGYKPRQLLYRFPPDSWVNDVEIRGDDLYVMTNAALYLIAGGRTRRENLRPRRLLWGTPVDMHVTWHGLAWGPEGDLYFSSGDPLLNYGDFQNRPDHFGHWTIFGPTGEKLPYTGVGGFFRCRPDGTRLQVVAGGTRGAVGIAFDRRWNLFSNDNDHESLADRYSPARLLHVAPRANFFWPRGWMAAMSPERSDLVDVVNADMGREVPVGQAYYDDEWLGPAYRDSLLVARWGQRRIDGYALAPRGASYQGREFPLLVGDETARPVGVAVGRGGRIFATLSYMAANEWSPHYPSELVMITRAADAPTHPYEPYDAPSAAPPRLWAELSNPSAWRRRQAHVEILRRGGPLTAEAVDRLQAAEPSDPAFVHLVWLAAASRRKDAAGALRSLLVHDDANIRAQAIRALAEFPELGADADIFSHALIDPSPPVVHAAVVALFARAEPLTEELFAGPARASDPLLRQAAALVIAKRATSVQLDGLLDSADPLRRLAGVLAAGFRLTVPPAVGEVPAELPLRYDADNAVFDIQYADGRANLKELGRVGSFTTAERWKAVKPSDDEQRLFRALLARLADKDDRVYHQAAYFLSLFNDAQANGLVEQTARTRTITRLAAAPQLAVKGAWTIGPLDDGPRGFDTVHPPEQGPIDLDTTLQHGAGTLAWQRVSLEPSYELSAVASPAGASSYLVFRLQTLQPQTVLVSLSGAGACKLWHNARAISPIDPAVLALEPGTNDILVRLAHDAQARRVSLALRAEAQLEITLPEKLGLGTLAERLRAADQTLAAAIGPEFLSVDWTAAPARGDAERGRKLFGADALGCVKCHAIRPNQASLGGPSLTDAAKRFTAAHLVESILAPSKQVAPVFATTSLVTVDGQSLAGLVVAENDERLTLLLPTAARRDVPKGDIEIRKLQTTSPMPSGLVKTPAELADLLAYLLSANPQAP